MSGIDMIAEETLVSDIASFHDDPLAFVQYAFPWDKGKGPDQWQKDFLSSIASGNVNQLAVSAGHGVGKSALVAWVILWAMSTRPHLTGVATANTARQLRDKTWRELAVWHNLAINKHWFEWTATRFSQVSNKQTWFVSAVPWSKDNPEAFAGLHAKDILIIFDEASAIPDIIWETAEGAMTTPNALWLAFGNPTRTTGRFRECFGKLSHRWRTTKVDARHSKIADQQKIAQWNEDYGTDSDFFRMRVTGDFPLGSINNLIPANDIDKAINNPLSAFVNISAPVILGVDPAWMGADRSAVALRQGQYGEVVFAGRGIDTIKLSTLVARLIEEYHADAVFVDQTGIGAGVVDQLRALGCDPVPVAFGGAPIDTARFTNRRAEMWWRMKEWLASGPTINPSHPELREDLVGLEYQYTANGKILLESKADMRARGLASPDLADALALTFAAPVFRKTHNAEFHDASDGAYDPMSWSW